MTKSKEFINRMWMENQIYTFFLTHILLTVLHKVIDLDNIVVAQKLFKQMKQFHQMAIIAFV